MSRFVAKQSHASKTKRQYAGMKEAQAAAAAGGGARGGATGGAAAAAAAAPAAASTAASASAAEGRNASQMLYEEMLGCSSAAFCQGEVLAACMGKCSAARLLLPSVMMIG